MLVLRLIIALCLVAISYADALADPLVVTLTIPNASGTIAQTGKPTTPFTAQFIKFVAIADTIAVDDRPGNVQVVYAPFEISIPDYAHLTIKNSSYFVFSSNTGAEDGSLCFYMPIFKLDAQYACASEPGLRNYNLRTSCGPKTLPALTDNNYSANNNLIFYLPSGEVLTVFAASSSATLVIEVFSPQPVPTLTLELLIALGAIVLAMAIPHLPSHRR